jgi:hypothetical protein
MQDNDDLSNYERLRLENIRRNQEFLSTLGLAALKPPPVVRMSNEITEAKKKKRRQTNESTNKNYQDTIVKRRSSRIASLPANEEIVAPITEVEEQEENDISAIGVINYEFMPQLPESLDDFEFECFVILKKWRLNLCRSLGIEEPYKVMQNRTLCEFIRRRRNDAKYAAEPSRIESDLLSCWGIGPAKAAIPDGFGYQLLLYVDEGESCESINELFEKSRTLAPSLNTTSELISRVEDI